MRRKPQAHYPDVRRPMDLASPQQPAPPTTPASQGDAIEPFLVAGGETFYRTGWAIPDNGAPPELGAVQLLAFQYVPKGRAAWVKSITVAPCVPPVLADPWRGWPNTFNYFAPFVGQFGTPTRAAAQAGLWETPLAWEGYYNPPGENGFRRPRWTWQLSILEGDLKYQRSLKNLGPFDPLDPATWYLVPDIAVPRVVYGAIGISPQTVGTIPGRQIPGYIGPQRFQRTPDNSLPCHFQVPENSTVCLWATWDQFPYDPLAANGGAALPVGPIPGVSPENLVWPLLPSVGSLAGYMQAAGRTASAENAAHGWGG